METEIKLAPALPHQADAVFADPAIAPYLGPVRKVCMYSRYFDTADSALGALGFALRHRQEGEAGVCALKGPQNADGARPELEAPADTLEQGIAALLAREDMPPAVRRLLEAGGLEQIAAVTFVRRAARYQRDGLVFELCFDQGECRRGARSGGLSELELELAAGSREAMATLADGLCARHGLRESTTGKLAQALALGREDAGRAVSPFFVSNELLNYCVRQGWLETELDEEKRLRYRLTQTGERELPARFGVDFGKPCAFAEA